MKTVKRIEGDYVIQSVNATDTLSFESETVNIVGNLEVSGNLTYINTEELQVSDPYIYLNVSPDGAYASNAGIIAQKTATTYAAIRFNTTAGKWELNTNTNESGTSGSYVDLGAQGTQGVQGTTGTQGTQGIVGAQGIQGIQGTQGTQGIQGVQGVQGVQGTTGTQGTQGIQGVQGTDGTAVAQGAQGAQGTQGIQGVQGATGVQGTDGTQGTTGAQGTDGTQGIQGVQGVQGTDGTQGIQGIQGTDGTQGIQGVQGVQGTQGTQGIQGTQGVQGTTGTQGVQGIQGAVGPGTTINATDTDTNADFELVFVSALGSSQTANGSTSLYYNPSTDTLTAPNTSTLASSAKYADLAERFTTDQTIDPATVVVFGGSAEITPSTTYADTNTAGVISTDPAYLMNSMLENSAPLVLAGRAPCKVIGPINRGDILTTSNTAGHATKLQNQDWQPGVIVGRALESCDAGEHVIEIVVGSW